MPKPGEHIVVHMVDEVEVGQQFMRSRLSWPLHITLVRWFNVGDVSACEERFEKLASDSSPFASKVGAEAEFGSDSKTTVNVMADPEPFRALHNRLVQAVRDSGGNFESEEWFGDAYKPHITHHGEHRRYEDDIELVDSFHLVRVEEGRLCTIVGHFALGGRP